MGGIVVITVLMAVYQTPLAMLREAVDSILGQTHPGFEFLIVNDGSRDPALLEYLARIEAVDRRIRVCHEPHRGLTRSLNRGLELARGVWIARQDADDWSASGRLARQLEFLRSHPWVSLCGSNAWTHQQSGRPLWPTDLPRTHAEIVAAFPAGNPFVHGAVVFSRRRALALGGYREEFQCSQDYDFFWRLSEAGTVANLEDRLYHYRYTAGSISAGRAAEQAIAYRAARELARVRAAQVRESPEHRKAETALEVIAALESAGRGTRETLRGVFRTQLKQADHVLLAGDYRAALRAYLRLIWNHPANILAWAKLARYGLFLALPPAREACFRLTAASPTGVPRTPAAGPDPLRVLFVIPGQGEGSSMIFCRRQAQSLAGQGARIAIFYLLSRTSPLRLAQEWARFRREVKRFRPHVVHAHYGTVTALFTVLASGNIPVVVTYRGSDLNHVPTSPGLRAWMGRLMSQVAALGATRIVCVSRRLKGCLWWRRDRVTVLASGVDTRLFRPTGRDEARVQLGWRQSSRVILFNAGRDPRNKRLDLAQAAAAAARRALPGLELKVLDGSTDPARVPLLMNAADCLLVTSDAEGSPTVVQEALATNLPIVSVDTGDVAERLAGVRRTRLAARDPRALGEALVQLLRIPGRSDGRPKAEDLSLARIARSLMTIYRVVAAPEGSRPAANNPAVAGRG